MNNLNWELKQLGRQYQDGSYATQDARARALSSFADFICEERGLRHLTMRGIKPGHIEAFVKHLHDKELATGTLKNVMAHLRWMAEKIGKRNIIARTNDAYGIADRVYVTNESKARELTAEELGKVTDPYCAMSLRLQAAFGLRREESLKIQPNKADRGDVLHLQASWCKGGRERDIPIRTNEQRQLLNEAKDLAGNGSLIPANLSYKAHLQRFSAQCQKAGIHKVHGHRHRYAQLRYEEITGWCAPACGGPTSKQLKEAQKRIDHAARMTISAELGHGREQITSLYLGR